MINMVEIGFGARTIADNAEIRDDFVKDLVRILRERHEMGEECIGADRMYPWTLNCICFSLNANSWREHDTTSTTYNHSLET